MDDNRLSRRRFITKMLPAVAALPLAQYGYTEALPQPGADTPVNLTFRVTSLEVRDSIMLAMMSEISQNMQKLSAKFLNPGDPWGTKPRAT